MDGVLDSQVRIKFDLLIPCPPKAHRQTESQFTARCLLAYGFQ
jgi:hypothetical protein